MAALSPHQRLHSFNAFHLERLGDSSDHRVLGNHLFVFLSGGWRQEWTRGLTDRGLRHPATVLPAVFVSLSLTHKPSTGSQCSAASHCVYESTVQYFMTWAEVIHPLQLHCLAGVSHLPAPGSCWLQGDKWQRCPEITALEGFSCKASLLMESKTQNRWEMLQAACEELCSTTRHH